MVSKQNLNGTAFSRQWFFIKSYFEPSSLVKVANLTGVLAVAHCNQASYVAMPVSMATVVSTTRHTLAKTLTNKFASIDVFLFSEGNLRCMSLKNEM